LLSCLRGFRGLVEKMKKEYFNTSEKLIKEKRYNIFIGISLGVLKPLTEKLAKEYISWALENTKKNVVILIADEIARFNYRIFSKYSEGKSLRGALKEGDKYEAFFRKIIGKFSEKEQKKVLILRWSDIWDEPKKKIKIRLEEKYKSNKEFMEIITSFVKKYAEKRKKELTEEQMDYLSQYILSELPTLLEGISYKSKKYDLLLYPTFAHSGMSDFVLDVEGGETFPELRSELGLDKSVAIVEFHLPVVK
jgi:tRNA-dependent cyclodipeptide synthase